MDVLPLVSFVLWATGLSVAALAGLMLLDWHSARQQRRASPQPPVHRVAPCAQGTTAANAPEARPLRKAA
ncbi:hypothetical protein SAMN04488120_10370 [Fontimonas thermophila]|uniref:Uncharacterized protein n=1 Tax=Fontimonas thermophila TaxID=1076937 RepID=A0A1I2IAG3_9GAMM|nr:hypothetical protein [Fontimonas thermophila]SFF37846.1 hypothetical protein SAMN04488120_10370 [Fontimonas thermophila]